MQQMQMKCDDTTHRSRPLAATRPAPACSGLLRLAPACSGLLRLAPACSGLLRLAPGETKRPVSPDRSPSRLRHSTPPATLTAWRPRHTPARLVLRALRSQPWGDHQHHLKQPEYPAQERHGSSTAQGPVTPRDIGVPGVAFRILLRRRHPKAIAFRGSIPGPHVPLSTLHPRSCERRCMTRGRRGSLAIRRITLPFTTPCRFLPAHRRCKMILKKP